MCLLLHVVLHAPLWQIDASSLPEQLYNDHCNVSDIADFQTFTNEKRWHFKENPCGFHHMGSEELLQMLRGKSILFVGDSSVRNAGLSLLASMCNPNHYAKCHQLMSLPFVRREKGFVGGFTCGKNMSDNTCGEIHHRFTVLQNLTVSEFYKTPEERRKYWKTKNVPPLLSLQFRDIQLHILEAACANHRDGLWVVLDYLQQFEVPFKYDMIVMSGGLHCSYRLYKGGMWYRSLFYRFLSFQEMGVPIVWLEITHCLKTDGAHYFKDPLKKNAMSLNYRKLASCKFIDKHAALMRGTAISRNARLVYTRHITKNLTLHRKVPGDVYKFNDDMRNESCVFMDPIHPSIECYGAIAQSLAVTLKSTLDDMARRPPNRTSVVVPSKPMALWEVIEGDHFGGELSLAGADDAPQGTMQQAAKGSNPSSHFLNPRLTKADGPLKLPPTTPIDEDDALVGTLSVGIPVMLFIMIAVVGAVFIQKRRRAKRADRKSVV